jgi:flagellar hook-basal body complex protein FliE
MNVLDSIRQLWPGANANPLTPPGAGASAPVSIPTAELSQLTSSDSVGATSATAPAGASFSSLLGGLVQDVNAKQNAAGQALRDLQSGQNVSLHQTMIATEEANVSFQLMVEVRNRLLDSYQELMRMSV